MVHEVGRIVGLLLFAISAAGEESPDPAELVRKYAANQDRLRSFVLKCEDMAEYDSTFDWVRGRRYKTGEIRYDGDRLSTRYRIWNDLRGESPTARDSDSYLSNLWDGERFIGYSAKPGDRYHGIVMIHDDPADAGRRANIRQFYSGSILMGYFTDDRERVDSILQRAHTVSVERERADVSGSACYVVNATTPNGTYRLWIDPERGYNIVRASVRRKGNDLRGGRPLPEGSDMSIELDDVRVQQIGDVWVPMECTVKGYWEVAGGAGDRFIRSVRHHKRTEIRLNPEFGAMNAFVPDDIEEGARTHFARVPGVVYVWRNGKPDLDIDEALGKSLDVAVEECKDMIRQDATPGAGLGPSGSSPPIATGPTREDAHARERTAIGKKMRGGGAAAFWIVFVVVVGLVIGGIYLSYRWLRMRRAPLGRNGSDGE